MYEVESLITVVIPVVTVFGTQSLFSQLVIVTTVVEGLVLVLNVESVESGQYVSYRVLPSVIVVIPVVIAVLEQLFSSHEVMVMTVVEGTLVVIVNSVVPEVMLKGADEEGAGGIDVVIRSDETLVDEMISDVNTSELDETDSLGTTSLE